MVDTVISTNIVMKHNKREDDIVLGAAFANFFIALCGLFLVYTCAIEPVVLDPQNREIIVVVSLASLIFFFVKCLKRHRRNK